MTRFPRRGLIAALLACGLFAPRSEAVVRNDQSPLAEKVVRHPNLHISTLLQPAADLQDELGARVQRDLAALGIGGDSAFYDARAGRLTSLILSEPLVPGTGVGNTLVGARPLDDAAGREAIWNAVRGYLQERQALVRVDVAELGTPSIGIADQGSLIQVHIPRVLNGIPVRDSGVTAVINHGNLVLLGLENWADAGAGAAAAFGDAQARLRVVDHVKPFEVEAIQASQLEYIPMVKGNGYEYRLVWAVRADVVGDMGTWEGLVDAGNGELIAFEDRNQYASRRVTGGVYPYSNDGRPPDGVEQLNWPMPFANVTIGANTVFTNSGGALGCTPGNGTTTLNGQFARIQDNCGAIVETSTGDIDLSFGPMAQATDCAVPPAHSAGDTKASRSSFYALNRIVEQAKGYLPTNTWLQAQLTASVNIAQQCSSFWNGTTVNFYRSSATCGNTGEIAGFVDHEWGHGMDDNGVNGSLSTPGEAIADIHAILHQNNSCVGRGLAKNAVCFGYGDSCIGTVATGCTGVRDADFAQHMSGLPHDITWLRANCVVGGTLGPCGRETHCEGQTTAEIGWDLQFRDMRAAPFTFDSNTALELTTRLFYLGSQAVTSWYTCAAGCETTGTCGCAATGGYLLVLGADDDNGNLNDGTPHMQAIRTAFNRHQQACNTPAVANTGCAGGPTAAPTTFTATPAVDSVALSWSAVTGATRYFVYRTEGVAACDVGKVKVGDVTGTTFTDTGLLSGRPYSYIVLPVGTNTSCFGRASACATATPTPFNCPPVPDFGLSCSPASFTINQGGSAPSACTVQSINAFASPVNLSCNGLPTGATCTFNPATVTPPSNGNVGSALTVAVAGTTVAGTYNFQAQGVSGGNTHTFNMSLTVVAVPDYSLFCNPPVHTIHQGASATSACAVVSVNAFASPVVLSCTGLPTGVTCSFNPGTVTPPPNGTTGSVLTLAVGAAVPTGTYNFQAQGVSGTLTHTFNMSVTVVSVAPFALSVDGAGNGVFQPNETVVVAPTWRNTGTTAVTLNAGTSGFTGPAGATYSNPDNTGSYGTIGANGQALCTDCYVVGVSAATRPLTHWDSTIVETTIPPTPTPKTWTLHIGNSFSDVPPTSGFYRFVETILHKNVTGGCTATTYCPANPTTRDAMAVFVLVSKEPPGYTPVACGATPMFPDVPVTSPFCRWVEELARRGVVGGCGGGNYCPSSPATREQMAIFVLRTLDPALNPPACAPPNLFLDVPETSPFCKWIEELANRGIVTGCGGGNYCPTANVSREQMGVFLAVTFGLTLYGL